MPIDPDKLLQLARERQGPAGVTLSWPTVLKIIEELRGLQREVGFLHELESHVPACRFHDQLEEALDRMVTQFGPIDWCDTEDAREAVELAIAALAKAREMKP